MKSQSLLPLHLLSVHVSPYILPQGFPGRSDSRESACNAGDPGSIPGLGRSPGEENGYPLRYSWLENSMDRRATNIHTCLLPFYASSASSPSLAIWGCAETWGLGAVGDKTLGSLGQRPQRPKALGKPSRVFRVGTHPLGKRPLAPPTVISSSAIPILSLPARPDP